MILILNFSQHGEDKSSKSFDGFESTDFDANEIIQKHSSRPKGKEVKLVEDFTKLDVKAGASKTAEVKKPVKKEEDDLWEMLNN